METELISALATIVVWLRAIFMAIILNATITLGKGFILTIPKQKENNLPIWELDLTYVEQERHP